MVPKIVSDWKADKSEFSQQLLTRLAELLHVLMYLHGGFPELYDPVYEVIKVIHLGYSVGTCQLIFLMIWMNGAKYPLNFKTFLV